MLRFPSVRSGLGVVSLVALGLVTASLAAQDPQDPQRPIFRSDAHFVTVDAYPLKDGKVVEGLTAADFIVEEDGTPQVIENFEFVDGTVQMTQESRRDPNTVRESQLLAAEARNRAFVVYLDIPHVSIEGARASRVPLITMLNRVIGENDLFAVTSSDQPPQAVTFGRNTAGAEDMLTRNWRWGTRGSTRATPLEEEFRQCFPHDPDGKEGWVRDGTRLRPLSDVLADRAREEQTISHLEDLVIYLGYLRDGRTNVVLFTEGWRLFNDDGGLMGYTGRSQSQQCDQYLVRYANVGLQSRFRDIIARANRSNVTFYPVNPSGLSSFDTPISQQVLSTGNINESALMADVGNLRDRVSSLMELAENTDGLAVVNTNDIKAGMLRIADELRSYYLFGYYSTNRNFDGKARRISVKVTQPGIEVKARRGYTAPTEEERAARAAAAVAPAGPTGPSPVEGALDVLARIRPSAELFLHAILSAVSAGAAGQTGADGRLTVVAELSAQQVDRGALRGGGTLDVTVTGAGGAAVGSATVVVSANARSVVADVDVPAGTDAVTVVAKMRGQDVVFDARAEVAQETARVLGSPRVYRATPSSRSPLLPVAGFDFRRTERVHLDFAIAGPLDGRKARLLGRSGQPVAVNVTLTERDVDGALMLAVDVLLAPLAPGDYVLEVSGTKGGVTDTRLIGIRVGN